MKKLLILAALAAGITTASAQSGGAAARAGATTKKSGARVAMTVAPNTTPGNGERMGGKINTAPATGATRASRSSSTAKAARQGKATGSGNIEAMSKNSNARPGPKK